MPLGYEPGIVTHSLNNAPATTFDLAPAMDTPTLLRLLSTVLKLEADGSNWPIFQIKFKFYLCGAGLDNDLAKSQYSAESYKDIEPKPTKSSTENNDDFSKRMDIWNDGEEKWAEGTRAWKKEDAKASSALGKVISNSLFMEVVGLGTFHEMWEGVEDHIE